MDAKAIEYDKYRNFLGEALRSEVKSAIGAALDPVLFDRAFKSAEIYNRPEQTLVIYHKEQAHLGANALGSGDRRLKEFATRAAKNLRDEVLAQYELFVDTAKERNGLDNTENPHGLSGRENPLVSSLIWVDFLWLNAQEDRAVKAARQYLSEAWGCIPAVRRFRSSIIGDPDSVFSLDEANAYFESMLPSYFPKGALAEMGIPLGRHTTKSIPGVPLRRHSETIEKRRDTPDGEEAEILAIWGENKNKNKKLFHYRASDFQHGSGTVRFRYKLHGRIRTVAECRRGSANDELHQIASDLANHDEDQEGNAAWWILTGEVRWFPLTAWLQGGWMVNLKVNPFFVSPETVAKAYRTLRDCVLKPPGDDPKPMLKRACGRPKKIEALVEKGNENPAVGAGRLREDDIYSLLFVERSRRVDQSKSLRRALRDWEEDKNGVLTDEQWNSKYPSRRLAYIGHKAKIEAAFGLSPLSDSPEEP